MLTQEDKKENVELTNIQQETVRQNHFTDTDVKAEWEAFLKQLRYQDHFVYNAINIFKQEKKSRN